MLPPDIEDFYPLSPMQQSMLLYSVCEPGTRIGFQQASGIFEARLDDASFDRAWQDAVDRHATLRTAFLWDGLKEPVQVVHRNVRLVPAHEDWRGLLPAEREERLEGAIESDLRQGFDLRRPPLMRLLLARIDDERYRFIWSYHHLLLDGWSLGLVLSDVFAAYIARLAGAGREDASPPKRTYRDYVAWLRSREMAAAEKYWRQTLDGVTPHRCSPNGATFASASDYQELGIRLPPDRMSALRSVARQYHVTLSTIVHAAWAVTLRNRTGGSEVVFGVTAAVRPPALAGVERIAGLCLNNVPVRIALAPDDRSTGAWLQEIEARQAALLDHVHAPLARIQEWSGVPRNVPLFDTLLVFENYPLEISLGNYLVRFGVRLTHAAVRTAYPVTLVVVPREDLTAQLVIRGPGLSVAEARGMLAGFEAALTRIAESPEQPMRELLDQPKGIVTPPPEKPDEGPTRAAIPPRNALELEIARFIEAALGAAPVGVRDNLIDLLPDSITALRLLGQFQARFGKDLPIQALAGGATIERIAALLGGHDHGPPLTPLIALEERASGRPFFCVHPAGGAAVCYLKLARRLGRPRPFYGLQARSLFEEGRSPATIEEMAADYVKCIRTVQPEGPYLLGGWSFGGVVAYEMASQLEAAGDAVDLLCLFDTRPPAFRRMQQRGWAEGEMLAAFLWSASLYAGRTPGLCWPEFLRLEPPEQWRQAAAELQSHGVLPATAGHAELRRLFVTWSANLSALVRYEPALRRPRAPVAVFRAQDKPPQEMIELLGIDSAELAAMESWKEKCAGPLEIVNVSGTHYTLLSEPHVDTVARLLTARLEGSVQSCSGA